MAIFAAMGKGKSRGVGEAARRAVHHFGNQGQRLKRAWTETFQQQ